MRTIGRILCTAAVVALAAPAVAGAATPRPGLPALDQYIEQIPTPSGPQPTGGEARVQPLPPAVERQVESEGGTDAEALTEIATSSRYGAPVETEADEPAPGTAPPPPSEGSEEVEEVEETGDEQTALEAAPVSAADDGDSRFYVLVAFMAASLVGALAFRLVRRRS